MEDLCKILKYFLPAVISFRFHNNKNWIHAYGQSVIHIFDKEKKINTAQSMKSLFFLVFFCPGECDRWKVKIQLVQKRKVRFIFHRVSFDPHLIMYRPMLTSRLTLCAASISMTSSSRVGLGRSRAIVYRERTRETCRSCVTKIIKRTRL